LPKWGYFALFSQVLHQKLRLAEIFFVLASFFVFTHKI